MKLFDELKWRGLVDNISDPSLEAKLNEGGLTFYIGADPTADSLHIGHYCSLLTAERLRRGGHHPVLLVGGATGTIGDPKPNNERPMLSMDVINKNVIGLSNQIKRLFQMPTVNNHDWLGNLNLISYLRDYGKYFNVNYMINKDTVKRRLDIGITYTEFSYMILQSIDFLHLYEKNEVTMQIGGQDQWGNMTAGLELIRKKHPEAEAYVLTMPLVLKADGTKFGKSESGAVWLDENKTSAYEMYQFFLNVEDSKVVEYLKKFTFLDKEAIETLEEKNEKEPHLREAHKALAEEVITFVHGEKALKQAKKISEALFKGNFYELSESELIMATKDLPNFQITEAQDLFDAMLNNEIFTSKRELKEFISSSSILINNQKVNEENIKTIKPLFNKYFLIRKGKKKYFLLIIS